MRSDFHLESNTNTTYTHDTHIHTYTHTHTHRIRSAPHTLEDVWFSALEKGSHSDAYAHAQWTHDLASFMETAEAGLM